MNKKRTMQIILCAVLAVILGVVVFASCTATEMYKSMNKVEVSEIQETEPATEATQAAEETDATEEAEETTEPTEEVPAYGDPDATNYLVVCKPVWKNGGTPVTETMILCSLNETTKAITMTALNGNAEVTLPKYKDIAGGDKAALNTVYGLGSKYNTAGSMELLNQTLYNNYGIRVHENLEIDMKLFSNVVKKIGGVEIEITEDEAKYLSQETGKEIKAGVQEMDGALAEEYVAMWSANAEGVSALNGQKKMVQAIVDTVSTKNVNNLQNVVMEILPTISLSMNQGEVGEVLYSLLPKLRDLSIVSGGIYPAA